MKSDSKKQGKKPKAPSEPAAPVESAPPATSAPAAAKTAARTPAPAAEPSVKSFTKRAKASTPAAKPSADEGGELSAEAEPVQAVKREKRKAKERDADRDSGDDDSDASGAPRKPKNRRNKVRALSSSEEDEPTEAPKVETGKLKPEAYVAGAISGALRGASAVPDQGGDALQSIFQRPVEVRAPAAARPKLAAREEAAAVSEAEEQPEDAEKDKRTVFVANVPTAWKTEQGEDEKRQKKLKKALCKHFEVWGPIESVRTRSIPLESIKVPAGSDVKRVRRVAAAKSSLDERFATCNAYVVYKEESGARAALESADGSEFLGNHLRVDALRKAGGKVFDRSRTVFVGNLAFEASEEELRKHVESLGVRVESVRIVRDAKTNLGKGFGYVLLMSAAAAEVGAAEAEAQAEAQAVQLAISLINGSEIRQRKLRANPCEKSDSQKKFKSKSQRAKFFESDKQQPHAGKRDGKHDAGAGGKKRKYGMAG